MHKKLIEYMRKITNMYKTILKCIREKNPFHLRCIFGNSCNFFTIDQTAAYSSAGHERRGKGHTDFKGLEPPPKK